MFLASWTALSPRSVRSSATRLMPVDHLHFPALKPSSRAQRRPVASRRFPPDREPVGLRGWLPDLARPPILRDLRPRSYILDEGWAEVGRTRASNWRKRGVDLLAQNAEHVSDPLFAARCEPVERRASKQHRTGAERQGLDYVGAPPKPAIDQNGTVDPSSKRGELLNRGCDVLQLASAVIGDDHPVHAKLNAMLSIFGAQQAFHE